MENIDINKILVPKKAPYGKESIKYHIAYNDDGVIRPICIDLPQMVGYVKHSKNNNDKDTITMFFNATDKKTIKKVQKNMGKSQQFKEYRI